MTVVSSLVAFVIRQVLDVPAEGAVGAVERWLRDHAQTSLLHLRRTR
jgi:hypothetical protein